LKCGQDKTDPEVSVDSVGTMKKNLSAFTLLEIMLVVSIIGILLTAAIYKFRPLLGFAQGTRTNGDIQSIRTALMAYSGSNGFYPSTEQGLAA
jgi:general secretion pathway protein G